VQKHKKLFFMNLSGKISGWDNKYPFLFAIIRVILGMILAIRGILFVTSIQPLFQLIKSSNLNELNINMTLAFLICWVHILGGTFIILGFLTRISAWAQIPILLGAIFFINLNSRLSHGYGELLFSLIVLALSIVFALGGGGKISMDNYAKRHLL
jgi:putative oxidoreductase